MHAKNKKKDLPILPHLRGGVGAVALNYFSEVAQKGIFAHRVVCLDYANQQAVDTARKAGFSLEDNMSKRTPELLRLIKETDIVLIWWWNHPLLYDFLVRERLPACGLIIWS